VWGMKGMAKTLFTAKGAKERKENRT